MIMLLTIVKETTQLQMFVSYVCQPRYICVVLSSSILHIGGWNCPEVMHK